MGDFKPGYFSARCLIQHCDPYRESEVLRIYQAEGAEPSPESALDRQTATRYVYPPSEFSFTVPFAMLPWGTARILWMIFTAGSLLIAAVLAWSLGATYEPILSGILIGFLLANSEVLLVLGNPSGVAIGLCVVAVWCFLRERCVLAGILCLAISLAIKPQEASLVWLYFLLAGGIYRRRALQALLATVALSLPGVLWAWWVSPHWMQEMHANIRAFAVHGGLNDPGPASNWAHGLVDLQVVVSVFRDDPRIYNPVSFLICAPLLLIWVIVTQRSRPSSRRTWLALAAIASLTMLPVHHHLYDTKLLMLTAPACAMLWAEGGRTGRFALLLTGAGFALTGDVSWTVLFWLVNHLPLPVTGTGGWILTAMHVFPAPLILLAMSVFYLWVYARGGQAGNDGEGASEAARC
jgi:uncharacterized membrane protein YciS (DUF1049 family)